MNFSNRAQKATLTVMTTPSVVPTQPVAATVTAVDSGDSDTGAVKVTWSPPGAEAGAVGFDDKLYWGKEQTNTPVVDYQVSYSIDGGEEWISAGADCAGGDRTECTISGLPAGTPVSVMVQAGGVAGFGAYSDAATAKTKDNEFSQECRCGAPDPNPRGGGWGQGAGGRFEAR